MPVILATWEAEIRRITVQSQPRQIVQPGQIAQAKTYYLEKIPHKIGLAEWLKW
jgi:hypothetical protein